MTAGTARCGALLAGALAVAMSAGAADAQTKLKIGCTATTDCASAMVARDQGIFAKYGIDPELVLIGINSNIPAAIVSDSIQIGGPTESVFLQAVGGGLDLVAVEGASAMDSVSNDQISAVERTGVVIKDAKDFIGKKVGAPGIGAFLQVLFVKYLIDNGVDPTKVNFIEVTFPTMTDALKSGAVDAVLTVEPFITRMANAGVGTVAIRYASALARRDPIISYVAARDYAEKNPGVIKNFRAAIEEGAKIVNTDRDAASASVSKFTKQPLEIVSKNRPNLSTPVLKPQDLAWWVDVLKQQGMLQNDVDPAKVVLP